MDGVGEIGEVGASRSDHRQGFRAKVRTLAVPKPLFERRAGLDGEVLVAQLLPAGGSRDNGTSPFGTRKTMPVYMEASILELPLIYLNGGKRGFLVGLASSEVRRLLDPVLVNVAIADQSDE